MNDTRAQILELRKSGLPYREIGKRLGITGQRANQIAQYGTAESPTEQALAKARLRAAADQAKRRAAEVAANLPPPPAPIDWDAVRAEQAAKPAADRWPYAKPALVERVWQTRDATWVPGASSIA